MKIAIFGATGRIGRQVTKESLSRGHSVTAVARYPSRIDRDNNLLVSKVGDVTSADDVASVGPLHDAVVSAVGPATGNQATVIVDAARALIAGMRRGKGKRLLVVGGAGSLFVAPGKQLLDTAEFPPSFRPPALAHRDALTLYREVDDFDWTVVSPAALVEPGPRTGHYRLGGDDLLVDDQGQSRISIEDFALAMVDELEEKKHPRTRITVAY